jgi:hypothetical protein
VQFNFIVKPNDTAYCKPWLTVTPNSAIIPVGELLVFIYLGNDFYLLQENLALFAP